MSKSDCNSLLTVALSRGSGALTHAATNAAIKKTEISGRNIKNHQSKLSTKLYWFFEILKVKVIRFHP
ncbi:hypothetical protein N9Z39_04440, partial [Alphaproteobacteria bacterium]|nr:hypothetical protein [Alphaproteobacteria bacterium]